MRDRVMSNDDDPKKNLELLNQYYTFEKNEEKTKESTVTVPSDLEDETCIKNMFETQTLQELMQHDKQLSKEIREYNSQMRTLIYENYKKFLVSKQTLKNMSTDFCQLEEYVNYLKDTLSEIKTSATEMDKNLDLYNSQVVDIFEEKCKINSLEKYEKLTTKLEQLKIDENFDELADEFFAFMQFMNDPDNKRYDKYLSKIQCECVAIIDSVVDDSLNGLTVACITTDDRSKLYNTLNKFGILNKELMLGLLITKIEKIFCQMYQEYSDELLCASKNTNSSLQDDAMFIKNSMFQLIIKFQQFANVLIIITDELDKRDYMLKDKTPLRPYKSVQEFESLIESYYFENVSTNKYQKQNSLGDAVNVYIHVIGFYFEKYISSFKNYCKQKELTEQLKTTVSSIVKAIICKFSNIFYALRHVNIQIINFFHQPLSELYDFIVEISQDMLDQWLQKSIPSFVDTIISIMQSDESNFKFDDQLRAIVEDIVVCVMVHCDFLEDILHHYEEIPGLSLDTIKNFYDRILIIVVIYIKKLFNNTINSEDFTNFSYKSIVLIKILENYQLAIFSKNKKFDSKNFESIMIKILSQLTQMISRVTLSIALFIYKLEPSERLSFLSTFMHSILPYMKTIPKKSSIHLLCSDIINKDMDSIKLDTTVNFTALDSIMDTFNNDLISLENSHSLFPKSLTENILSITIIDKIYINFFTFIIEEIRTKMIDQHTLYRIQLDFYLLSQTFSNMVSFDRKKFLTIKLIKSIYFNFCEDSNPLQQLLSTSELVSKST